MRRSLVLTGFMGTGKTSAGRMVAQKLGREFIDLDALIETRTGKTIREIFATEGEAYFRRLEAELCAELGARENLVIATGGGAFVNPQNRAAFAKAFVVCLDASVGEIIARIGNATDRPLLAGDAPQRIETLLRERADAYARITCHVDTTGKSVEQVADEIIAVMEMNVPIVVTTPEGHYPVWVGHHIFDRLVNVEMPGGCVIITHPHLGTWYAGRISQILRSQQIQTHVIEIPVGENAKTLDTVRLVYDQLIDAHLDRQTTIVALGGGVVGDLAGLVAATYLRGVPFVQMPTTLLAMVDASIGGKVAVDHPRGKNLIGAFKQPRAVIADVSTLQSLPAAEWRAGMAEVVKHGIIGDATLFEELEKGSWKLVGSWLARAIRVKAEIVSRDPFEQGERAKLNLGHTFGHALELVSQYQLRHGEAVAIGLVCAARLAQRRAMCDATLVERIKGLLQQIGLPTCVPRALTSDALVNAMQADKKRVGARLRFVLPCTLGEVVIVDDVSQDEVKQMIEEVRE